MDISFNHNNKVTSKAMEAYFKKEVKRIKDTFMRVGEAFVNDSRMTRGYEDRTGNLRSSKGYAIGLNGDVESSTEDIKITEDLGTIQIPEDLAKSLYSLSENLKNQVFFNSVSISIFSFLEFSLIEYCRLIDCYIEAKKPFKDYRNYGIDKVKDYIKDNFNIDFGALTHWDDISKFQKVRNPIVHNDPNIIKDYGKPIEEQPVFHVSFSITRNNSSHEIFTLS